MTLNIVDIDQRAHQRGQQHVSLCMPFYTAGMSIPPIRRFNIVLKYTKVSAALGVGLLSLLSYAAPSNAQQSPVTAIDIALEPDASTIY